MKPKQIFPEIKKPIKCKNREDLRISLVISNDRRCDECMKPLKPGETVIMYYLANGGAMRLHPSCIGSFTKLLTSFVNSHKKVLIAQQLESDNI